jgi:hypothetical protein
MLDLLNHQLKEKLRSAFWQKNLFLNILLALLGIYIFSSVVIIGYFADNIIHEIYKDRNIIEVFSSWLFYYFAFDLILRFLFQPLPILAIKPYLILPVKKNILCHYPLIKSIPGFFNIIAVLVFTPFFIKVVCHSQTPLFSLGWIIIVISGIIMNNYLTFLFKKYFSKRPLIIFMLLAILGSVLFLDIKNYISCSILFYQAISYLSTHTFLIFIPVLLAATTYFLAYNLLKQNSYIEDINNDKRLKVNDFSFLDRYGETGNLMQVEIKLILRNKRPRSLLFISLIFLLYGLMFYQKQNMENYFILTITGLILTSAFAINYGQFLFSWESSFFDGYMANKISAYNYIKSKYLLLFISCIVTFILTLPYALISYKIALINLAMLLFNLGFTIIAMLVIRTFNSAYIDLGRSQFMNYQGTSASQFIIVVPLIILPLIVYFILKLSGIDQYYFHALAIIGLTGIIFNKYLLQIVVKQFLKRRHKMALNFKKR